MADKFNTDQSPQFDLQQSQGLLRSTSSTSEGVPSEAAILSALSQTSQMSSNENLQSSTNNGLPLRPISNVDIRDPNLNVHNSVTLKVIYAVQAVKYFFKAIQLAEGSRLEDTLRLLMLWFDYGDQEPVFINLRENYKSIPIETWLEVVPQLMARLDSQKNVGYLVKQVVIDVSKVHPQVPNSLPENFTPFSGFDLRSHGRIKIEESTAFASRQ